MNTKKQYIYDLICNVAAWGIFSLIDLLNEKHCIDEDSMFTMMFIAPVLVFMIFLEIFDTNHEQKRFEWKQHLRFCLRYLAVGLVTGGFVTIAVLHNFWIIRQCQLGYYDLFNGFEYPVFGAVFLIVSIVEFIVYGIVKYRIEYKTMVRKSH